MSERNKTLSEAQPASLVELLFEPLSGEKARHTLFIVPHGNLVRKFDFEEFAHEVTQFARGMSATNLKRGCRVALLCRNSIKSTVACFANLLNGYVNVVLPLGAEVEETLQALSSSRTECLIVDTLASALPLLTNISNLPQLRQIIVLDETALEKHPQILCANWTEILGRSHSQPDRQALLRQAITLEQEAFLYFQPDTEGRLRGSAKTHGQILADCRELMAEMADYRPLLTRQSRLLAILPFSHSRCFMLSAALPLMLDHSCMALDPSETWKIEGLSPRNTLLIAEPDYLQSIVQKIESRFSQGSGLRQKLWQLACESGRADAPARRNLKARLLGWFLQPLLHEHINGRLFLAIATDTLPDSAKAPYTGMGVPVVTLDSRPHEMIAQRSAESAN